jgi:hypothetical protein
LKPVRGRTIFDRRWGGREPENLKGETKVNAEEGPGNRIADTARDAIL